jgi:hypothetical protein
MQPDDPSGGKRTVDVGTLIFGLLILGIGGYLLLKDTLKIAVPEITWDAFWPVILIVIGVAVLLRALTGNSRRARRRDR